MKHKYTKLFNTVQQAIFETNTIDPFIPEIWAEESLMVLENNLVAAQLVHRDFSNEIANFGDTVNTRKPGTYEAKRKGVRDNVTIQNTTATNVAVTLDQHLHTSFLIRDGEESKGFKNLRQEYLDPALLSIAQALDEILLAQVYQYLSNWSGKLSTDPTKSTILDLRKTMNNNKVPMQGRNLVVTPGMESAFLGISEFINAEKIGDDGTALREGSLGRKFGFDTFMSQNVPSIDVDPEDTGAVNNTNGYSKGATSIDVDGFTVTPAAGQWFTVAGDMIPQRITSISGSTWTFEPGLGRGVNDNAEIKLYEDGAINNSGGYSSGEIGSLTVDGFTKTPQAGQLMTFGTNSGPAKYGLINSPTQTDITLARPLVNSVNDDEVAGMGPAGDFAFAFHRNALALVSRPLAQPANGLALSSVSNNRGLSIRVTITYNGEKQGHLVTVDMLAGVKVLDSALGAVMFG